MSPPELFEGAELLTNWFGKWPSFHDAEILSVTMHRAGSDPHGHRRPIISVEMHAFQMTPETDGKGFFKLTKHCVMTLVFEGVEGMALHDFNHQNVIGGIAASVGVGEDGSRRILVQFSPIYGMDLEFSCSRAVVAGLNPGKPAEGVYAQKYVNS